MNGKNGRKDMAKDNIIQLLLFCFLSIAAFSCNNSLDKQQLILGEWQSIDEEDLEAYSFQGDSTCMYKPGYFTYFDEVEIAEMYEMRISDISNKRYLFAHLLSKCIDQFLGSKTAYNIQGDSLFIFDLAQQEEKQYEIIGISPDTLRLSDENGEKIFAKKHYKQDTIPPFDRVIVNMEKLYRSTDGHHSEMSFCSSDYVRKVISVNFSNREVHSIFFSTNWESSEYFQTTEKIDHYALSYLESLYRQANIDTFLNRDIADKREPISRRFDRKFPDIVFVKNNKMHWVRHPLGVFDTKEFVYAYAATLFADHAFISPSEQVKVETQLFKLDLKFKQGEKMLLLSYPEEFYLTTLLYDAEETDQDFTPLYSLISYERLPKRYVKILMETDGRYYRFKQDGKLITLDIGFNFIEINNLEDQFVIEEDWSPKVAEE